MVLTTPGTFALVGAMLGGGCGGGMGVRASVSPVLLGMMPHCWAACCSAAWLGFWICQLAAAGDTGGGALGCAWWLGSAGTWRGGGVGRGALRAAVVEPYSPSIIGPGLGGISYLL